MNREEAYNSIDAIIAKYEIDEEYVTITSALDYDALRVARKALVQQPCKDAIGREDMLDAIGHGTTYTSEELQRIIKGLPPVNPQSTGDLISRQSAIFLASDLKQDLPDDEHLADIVMAHNEGVSEYQTQLSLLPSVNPQQKTGHWISLDDFRGKYNERGFKCSECDEHSSFEESFCRGCGAKMVEPQERSE